MNKKKKWIFISLPVLFCALVTLVYSCLFVVRDDKTAPVITMDSEELEVSVTAEEAELLQGLTAADNKDGDVTANVLVEGISNITEENTATITYAAFDAAGNVAKATRTLKYTDYESPKFGQKQALVFSSNTSLDILSCMTAEDKLDGDISDRIKATLVSDTASISYPGVHQVEFRVTNSRGDTEHVTLPVDVYEPNTYNATVELSEYLVRLEQFAEFSPESYLENLVVGRSSYSLKDQDFTDGVEDGVRTYINDYMNPAMYDVYVANVTMNSDVNTKVPGVYSVTYTVDLDNDYVGYTRLNVVVEE